MPKSLELALKKKAEEMGLSEKQKGAYIYGTMQKKTSWKPGKKNKK